MILPADKGRVRVVIKKSEYQEKCEHLLNDEKMYKNLKGDPTRKYKVELSNVLRDLKDRKIITLDLHRKLYTPWLISPHISTASQKSTRITPPLLSPLMGKMEHHVKNSKEFAEYVKSWKVGPEEKLRSYNVSALFTSVPVDKALEIILRRLTEDVTFPIECLFPQMTSLLCWRNA